MAATPARAGARWLEAAPGAVILLVVEAPVGAGAAGFAAGLAGAAALRNMAAKGLEPGGGGTVCLLSGTEAVLAGGPPATAAASALDQSAGAAVVEGAVAGWAAG
ncbi:hypothetical protein [Acidocella sp.]|uniref:hypothetical protein n=1 Tax=Acidocella sp. TaxID=50710 RepID=UPI00262ACB3B|nr:hypothetical protein [Acidocella sp.]